MTAMSSVFKIAEVFPPEEEKSEFQMKKEENCKLQTAQGMISFPARATRLPQSLPGEVR